MKESLRSLRFCGEKREHGLETGSRRLRITLHGCQSVVRLISTPWLASLYRPMNRMVRAQGLG